MTAYIIPIINLLGSLCSIISFISIRKNRMPKWNYANLALGVLLLITAIFSFYFIRAHDTEINARVFYDRYKNKSFTNDFSGDKLRAVVMDGMIILRKINLKETDPIVYNVIESKFEEIQNKPFSKDEYVSIARMIFGACGSISGDLYSEGSYVWPSETQ